MIKADKRRSRFPTGSSCSQEISKRYLSGHSASIIAADYQCSIWSIYDAPKREGVALRCKGATLGVAWTDLTGRSFVMKSSWELKTASYLDGLSKAWDYEVCSFDIGQGQSYTPDFWVYDNFGKLEKLIDVKGHLWPKSAASIESFKTNYPELPFEIWGQQELGITNYAVWREVVCRGLRSVGSRKGSRALVATSLVDSVTIKCRSWR